MIRTDPLADATHALQSESAAGVLARPIRAPHAPVLCIACSTPPTRSFQLANGAALLRCPRCLLGWWDWPPFDPREFYDANYFQSATQSKGYDDYAALEPAIRLTAQERLVAIENVFHLSNRGDSLANTALPDGIGAHRPHHANQQHHDDREGIPNGRTSWFRPAAPSLKIHQYPPRVCPSRLIRPALQRRARTPCNASEPFILDIGCGTGVFLDESRGRGWRPHGLEVSAYAVQQARSRGLAVRQTAIEGVELPPAAFDCITMWDVIEHLRDPIGVIAQAASALKPAGVMAISTGDISSLCARFSGPRWHLFNLPEHLFFYSPSSLRLLLLRAGLRVVSIRREVSWYTADYLVERLVKSLLRRSWQAGTLRSWLQRIPVPAALGDIVSVYAVKPG